MYTQDSHKVIVIIGPTAIGKTEIANQLNSLCRSVIISADSRQVYKELSIGTAKPPQQQIETYSIKLVDHVSINESYSAGRFVEEAQSILDAEIGDKRIPIVCGGTGLYIKSLFHGIDDFPDVPESVSVKLDNQLDSDGIESLSEELQQKDPDYYEIVDKRNHRRIVRALSVIRSSGETFSSFLDKQQADIPYQPIYVILDDDREKIYQRINVRVDQMFEDGLLDEVKGLQEFKDHKALHTVGYTEVFRHLEGDITLEECKVEIKKNTRRYAKRQMTWNRNQVAGNYFNRSDISSIKAFLESHIK